jgi:hypothetical protein
MSSLVDMAILYVEKSAGREAVLTPNLETSSQVEVSGSWLEVVPVDSGISVSCLDSRSWPLKESSS